MVGGQCSWKDDHGWDSCLIWSPRELVVGEHDVVKTGGAVDQNSDSLVLGRDLDTNGHKKVDIDSGIWTAVDLDLNVDMVMWYIWSPPQTWNLSKNLHRWIFRLKILHRQFYLISTVLVRKKHKKWVKMEKVTPLANILHCRRQWRDGRIPPLLFHKTLFQVGPIKLNPPYLKQTIDITVSNSESFSAQTSSSSFCRYQSRIVLATCSTFRFMEGPR